MSNYAGVDWAAGKHDVRVADETGEELLVATFAHDEKGLRALCRALLQLKVQLAVPAIGAIESLPKRLSGRRRAGLGLVLIVPGHLDEVSYPPGPSPRAERCWRRATRSACSGCTAARGCLRSRPCRCRGHDR